MKPIIDISKYQDPTAINYDLIASQVSGVILRAAYGRWEDTAFEAHYLAFTRRGVPVGAYHYLIGSVSIAEQVNAYCNFTAGKELKLGEWMDVEDTREGTKLYRKQVLDYAALMPEAGIYTSKGAWNEIMGGVYLNDRKLWVAHYTTASTPLLPTGWSKYWLWQYTSSGRMNGYAGNLDTNRFGGTQAEFNAWIEDADPVTETKLFDARVITTGGNRLKTRYTPNGNERPQADWLKSGAVTPVYETTTGWYRVEVETWASAQWLQRLDTQPPAVLDWGYYGPVFSQRDIRWASHPLGTKSTIGAHGCLMTCASMVCNAFGHMENPLELNDWLTSHNGYLDGNLFLWAAIERLYPDMKFAGFVYNPTTAQIASAIRAGVLPIMYVDFNDSTPQVEMHWVLGIGVMGNEVVIADPWTGTMGKLSEMYPKPVLRYGSYRWQA